MTLPATMLEVIDVLPATVSILLLFPVVLPINTLPLNSAKLTVPSAFTSILGIPLISFTLKIVPVKSFVIENNCPAFPSNDRVPLDSG